MDAAGATHPDRITDPVTIRQMIAEHGRWWHEIELAPGIVTPGDDSNRSKLSILDDLGLPPDLRGLRAVDIGCSDGYFSFELERRGAEVTAIDFVPETYTGFAVAKKILGSRVQYRMENVYNLDPAAHGMFDIVLFFGVLYHLRKPLAALDAIRSITRPGGQLFVGTMMIDEYLLKPDGEITTLASLNPLLSEIPLWQAYPADTLNGDATNCFAPNRRALEVALTESQFRVDRIRIVSMGGYACATAVDDQRTARYQRLDSRLEKTPFDPAVPYFLDEEGSVHNVTPVRSSQPKAPLMNLILFGGSGMVGQGVLREALLDPGVERVLSIGRSATGQQHPKLRELVQTDLFDYSAIEPELTGYDTCIFTLGVSAAGMTEEAYARVNHDLTLAAAATLVRLNPAMTFLYVSGTGTDSTEKGRVMWARVKGRTENDLLKLPFRAAYMFRPGFIQPLHGIRSKTKLYNFFYVVLAPILPLMRRLFPRSITTTEQLGRAMLSVAKHGAPQRILEARDITAPARPAA